MSNRLLWTNNASGELALALTAAATKLSVRAEDAALFPTPALPGESFLVTVEDLRVGQREVMRCTARAGVELTVVRGQEGTSAQSFAVGAVVSNRVTAGTLNWLVERANSLGGLYLGPSATPPFADNAGGPLQAGMVYFDTASNDVRVWTGTVWRRFGDPVPASIDTYHFDLPTGGASISGEDADGRPLSFSVEANDVVAVHVNGLRLIEGEGYGLADEADTITFTPALTGANHVLVEVTRQVSPVFHGGAVVVPTDAWLRDGRTTYPLVDVNGNPLEDVSTYNILLSIDGVLQQPGAGFTVTGTDLNLSEPLRQDSQVWLLVGVPLAPMQALYDEVVALQASLESSFAAAVHTHPASQISDSTATGRDVLTAADAAAARTTLGLGSIATLASPLPAGNGGTGQTSYTVGDILYASGTGTLAKLAAASYGNALIAQGAGIAPVWGKIDLAATVTGTLPIANGGTGATTAAAARTALGLDTPTFTTQATIQGFAAAPTLDTTRAAGTAGSPTDVASGNNLMYLQSRGYYSGAYRVSGVVTVTVDGTPSGGSQVPGRFSVLLSDGTSAAAEKLRLSKDGQLAVGFAGAPGASLHVEGASSPELRLRATSANASSRLGLIFSTDASASLRQVNGTTAATALNVEVMPTDGTSQAWVQVNRATSTSGNRGLRVMRGDNTATVDHELRSGGSGTSSYINGQGGRLGICLDNPSCVLDIGGQDAVWLTTGTTAQRPSSPQAGMIRCNSDLGRTETYQHGLWAPVGTGMVLLTQTVVSSSVGSVAFNNLRGFDHLMLVVYGAKPSTSANLCLQVATGASGDTWQSTNYDFQWSVRLGGGSAWTYGSVSSSNVFRVSDTTNVDNHNHGVVYLSTCGNTRPKIARADFISWHPTNGLSRSLHEGIWHNPSSLAVTGVQFWYDGGSTNITGGTFSLYGVA